MSSRRILLAPAPDSGGLYHLEDEVVTITRAELEALRSQADPGLTLDRDARTELTEALRSSVASHAAELVARDRKAAELERAYRGAVRDRELATALVGRPLVAGAAAQLIKLWRDDFEVVDDGGECRVVARDGRGVDQAVAGLLAEPAFAHFCLPTSRGGTGARGQNRSATPAPAPPAPKTLGEAVVLQWREAARSSGAPSPAGWGKRR